MLVVKKHASSAYEYVSIVSKFLWDLFNLVKIFWIKESFSISLKIRKHILNGSENGVEYSGLLGFWTLSFSGNLRWRQETPVSESTLTKDYHL
jgi:hypothetical protein